MAEPNTAPAPAASASRTKSTITRIPLDKTLALRDAVSEAKGFAKKVIGYRYTAPGIEGEFFPTAWNTVDQFTRQFELDYGTQPEVSSLLVEEQVDQQQRGAPGVPPAKVKTSHGQFKASAPQGGKLWGSLEASKSAARNASEAQVTQLSATSDWRPYYTKVWTGYSPTQRLIQSEYIWNKDAESLQAMPAGWGLEFEVNLHYSGDGLSGVRPFCVVGGQPEPTVSERFWAQNKNWSSWTVYYTNGSSPASNIESYADLNDLSDSCTRQSIAVGVGEPRKVLGDLSNNQQAMGVQIVAPAGWSAVNQVAGVVQATYGGYCNNFPWNGVAHTDCMGITAGSWPGLGSSYYTTLSLSGAGTQGSPTVRKPVYTPEACWTLVKNQVPYKYPCWMQGYPM